MTSGNVGTTEAPRNWTDDLSARFALREAEQ